MNDDKYQYIEGQSPNNLTNANWSDWQVIPYAVRAEDAIKHLGMYANNSRAISIMLSGMKIVDVGVSLPEDQDGGSKHEILLEREGNYFIAYFDDSDCRFYIAPVDYFEVP